MKYQKNGKELLFSLADAHKIKDYVKCVVIYGSFSSNFPKNPTEISDIDFIVVYKEGADISSISRLIEEEFKKAEIKYDYGWYTEEYFNELLDKDIDFYFFYNVFRFGEIVYAEEDFKRKINEFLSSSENPLKTLLPTFQHRFIKNQQFAQKIMRNLHRMILDAIWTKYYVRTGEIPDFSNILKKSRELGIVDDKTIEVCNRLEHLRKIQEHHNEVVPFNELHDISLYIYSYILLYITASSK